VTDTADAIAEQLQAAIDDARHRAVLAERAPELELKLAAHEAIVSSSAAPWSTSRAARLAVRTPNRAMPVA
jgi:hypothetical protein